MKRNCLRLAASLVFVALLCMPSTTWAQVAPKLGVAQRFGVLGNSGVTGSTGSGTVVNGDVGSAPSAPAIVNFPPSTTAPPFIVFPSANAVTAQAHTDAANAATFLAGQGGSTLPGPGAADELSGRTLTAGVYALGAGDLAASTILTLSGPGIFIFNVASTLTMNGSSSVNMIGGVNPCNVFWQVGSSATLNGLNFIGTVIAGANITVGGGNVQGSLLAGTGATGAVTMPGSGGNVIGGCSVAPLPPTVTKAFSPANITPGGVSRLTITLSNANAAAIALTAAFTDNLPSGVLVAATPNPITTCGGAVTAASGASAVTLAASSAIPAGSCTIAVNVTAPAAGSFVNTIPAGALQTINGNNAAPASATLAAATCPVITIAPPTLPLARVGAAYSQQLAASGGSGSYTFTVSSGPLPAGLTLTPGGLLSGTPTTAGSSTVTIQAADGNGCPGTITYSIVIAGATCPVITPAPSPLQAGFLGVAYSQQITASGGAAPYTFSVLSGTLPAGLTLSSSGLLSGTPTAPGTSTIEIRATDGAGCPGLITYTMTIVASVPTLPQVFVLVLTLGLIGIGYFRLRQRGRVA
jgi:hypothetical protein